MNVSYEVSIVDLVTLAIAGAGLALSVVNFATELVRRQPHAKVVAANYLDIAGNAGLAVTIANTGECPFTITDIGLVVGRNQRLLPAPHSWCKLPKVLHPGETCETVVDRSCYADAPALKVKCAFARTALGKEFYSQRLSKKFLGIK
jgi:hypothetical protein